MAKKKKSKRKTKNKKRKLKRNKSNRLLAVVREPVFRQRVVQSKKKYNRKKQQKVEYELKHFIKDFLIHTLQRTERLIPCGLFGRPSD